MRVATTVNRDPVFYDPFEKLAEKKI